MTEVQDRINRSLNTYEAEIARSDAVEIYNNKKRSAISIVENISKSAQGKLRQWAPDCEFFFSAKVTCTSDHQALLAARSACKNVLDSRFNLQGDLDQTYLVLNPSAGQLSRYYTNPNVSFAFVVKETKDRKRFNSILTQFRRKLRENLTKADKDFIRNDDFDLKAVLTNKSNQTIKPKILFYKTLEKFLSDFAILTKIRIYLIDFTKPLKSMLHFDNIMLYDVGYTFSEKDWLAIAQATTCNRLVGYMFLPNDLLFDLPPNSEYDIVKKNSKAYMVYNTGNSSGYYHDYDTWSLLLRKQIIGICPFKQKLYCEFFANFGPMRCFEITPVNGSMCGTVIRKISLADYERTVSIIDVRSTLKKIEHNIDVDPIYIDVYENDYWAVKEFAMSLNPKALTMTTLLSFARRTSKGIKMNEIQYAASWLSKFELIEKICECVYFEVVSYNHDFEEMEKKFLKYVESRKTTNISWLAQKAKQLAITIFTLGTNKVLEYLYLWAKSTNKNLIWMKPNDSSLIQKENYLKFKDNPIVVDYSFDSSLFDDEVHCDICDHLDGNIGQQKLYCIPNDKKLKITITKDQIDSLKTRYIEAIDKCDKEALRSTLINARDNLPVDGFTIELGVYLFEGGPGTGKTFIAKQLIDSEDLVVFPFSALTEDYKTFENSRGDVVKPRVSTIDKAIYSTINFENVFVDEYTNVDYVKLCCILYINGAKNVFLFGDCNQTHLLPTEGVNIHPFINENNTYTHKLLINFRNPIYIVALLNKLNGTSLTALSKVEGIPKVIKIGSEEYTDLQLQNDNKYMDLFFTKDTATLNGYSDEDAPTVRSNQGKTYGRVKLYVTDRDLHLFHDKHLLTVAISRHTDELIVCYDGEEAYNAVVSALKLEDQEFRNNYHNFAKFTYEEQMKEKKVDPEPLNFIRSRIVSGELNGEIETYHDDGHDLDDSVVEEVDDLSSSIDIEPDITLDESSRDSEISSVDTNSLDNLTSSDDESSSSSDDDDEEDDPKNHEIMNITSNIFNRPSGFTDKRRCAYFVNKHFLDMISKPRFYANTNCDQLFEASTSQERVNWCSYDTLKRQLGDVVDDYKEYIQQHDGIDSNNNNVTISAFDEYCRTKAIKYFIYYKVNDKYVYQKGNVIDNPVYFVNIEETYKHFSKPDDSIFIQSLFFMFNGRKIILPNDSLNKLISETEYSYVSSCKYVNELIGRVFIDNNSIGIEMSELFFQPFIDKDLEDIVLTYSGDPTTYYKFTDGTLTDYINNYYDDDINEFRSNDNEYLFHDIYLPYYDINNLQYINEPFSSVGMLDKPRNGIMDPSFLYPLNVRNMPKNKEKKAYNLSVGYGNKYFQESAYQTLQALQHRYLRKRKVYIFCERAKKSAHKIADLAFDELMNKEIIPLSDEEISETISEFSKSANSKHYEERYHGEILNEDNVVMFHLKDIFKPYKNGKFNPNKVGQGISAWSAKANLTFGIQMRLVNKLFKKNLKANVIYNNGYTEEETILLVNSQLKRNMTNSVPGVVDATEFDSCQNQYTQTIEKRFLERMGINKEFIARYYKYRNNYKIISPGLFIGHGNSEKTSGEPGTLLLNSILELCVSNAILRGQGPFMMIVQGDDCIKHQPKLNINNDLLREIKMYANLNLKIEIGQGMEFCGNIICNSVMIPCIYRTFQKLTGKDFRDLKHFQEYQQSLRDKIALWNKIGLELVWANNAAIYNTSVSTVIGWYYNIVSFSHIGENEFYSIFKEKVYNLSF